VIRFAGRVLPFNSKDIFMTMALMYGWIIEDTGDEVDMRKVAMNCYQEGNPIYVVFTQCGTLILGNNRLINLTIWELFDSEIVSFNYDDAYGDRSFSHSIGLNNIRRVVINDNVVGKQIGSPSIFENQNEGNISNAIHDAVYTFTSIDIYSKNPIVMRKFNVKLVSEFPEYEKKSKQLEIDLATLQFKSWHMKYLSSKVT
jgi:hypothetical protein